MLISFFAKHGANTNTRKHVFIRMNAHSLYPALYD